MKKLLLGSNSPRRADLLSALGFDFERVNIATDEDFDTIDTMEVAGYLARKKSLAFNEIYDSQVLLTADTIVIAENTVLNKPTTKIEAMRMLALLSDKKHLVKTGVCIRSASNIEVFTETTEVFMESISPEEMQFYIDNYEPYDKAGGYGIQEWIGLSKVKQISGCYYNVMGLPTQKVFECLTKQFNLYPKNFIIS